MECVLNEAKISGNINEIERRIESLSTETDECIQNIKLALSKGNEDLAKKLLQKKLDNDKYFASLTTSYNNATAKGESLKLKLRELDHNIYETKIYKNEAVARYNAAEAHKKINEIIGNISTKNNSISLSNIEKSIERNECFVTGLSELNFNNELNIELANLTSIDLNVELKKYI